MLFTVHYLLETLLLTLFFLHFLTKSKFLKLLLLIFVVIILNLMAANYLGDFSIHKYVSLVSNIITFVFSINYILTSYSDSKHEKLTHDGYFIVSTAIMFFAGIQFYFSLFESVIRSDASVVFYYLWPIFQIGGILYYVIFTYGLWTLRKS